jgi:hypothetical protein
MGVFPCTHNVNAIRIRELIDHLPDESEDVDNQFGQVIEDTRLKSNRDREIRKYTRHYKDLSFGWKFIKSLERNGIQFPMMMDASDEWLIRAYRFETDPTYEDDVIFRALELTYPETRLAREAINGMLVAKDYDLDSMSNLISVPKDVISAYQELFFNINDRRDEILFLAEVVYPNGRIVECIDNYMRNESLGNLLMRAGYNNSMADVLYFAGCPSNLLFSMLESDTAVKLESLIMANGYLIARNFLVNQQRDAAGLFNARSLIQAAKQGGQETDVPSEWQNAGSSMKEQMLAVKGALADEQQKTLMLSNVE